MDQDTFDYEVSGNPISIGLVKLLHTIVARSTGRGMGLAMRAVRPLIHSQTPCVHFADGSRLYFELDDAYWNAFFVGQPHRTYESDIAMLLLRLKDVDYTFFDCGANIGYWSVLVTSEMLGRKRAIAVEASRQTLAILEQNRSANDRRFEICRKALFETDGQMLSFSDDGSHDARHIVTSQGMRSKHVEPVVSITLDSLARQLQMTDHDRLVVKLDVEGAEISAFKGAREVLKRDTLIIYEDHGNDRSHTTTRYMLETEGFPVFSIAMDGAITKVEELGFLDRVKTNPRIGYNFVTCPPGSGFHQWMERAAGRA
ncbi:FkbM family methyltransferase [Bradyrhizobium australafricanum]|uniref:FkbM family methyltransferase n=1 Tax=Bradyrhizobium australafricanum TaxID=2821406 RepID=UPI001CE29430|nr:FkbM family methyltransferase [Bradyrhizobium australafricanum]